MNFWFQHLHPPPPLYLCNTFFEVGSTPGASKPTRNKRPWEWTPRAIRSTDVQEADTGLRYFQSADVMPC